ncbi:MAG: proline--tRNA ligase [Deferribacteraceae bacterium]|jgi:prolyl-tRNA synthetase|nr:proline--tRNA ligase [Deferribacteraceae bacterium]
MRVSSFFLNTQREAPAEAEVLSHILMVRAFMIRKLATGIFTYLPMGYRVIRKIEQIVRECMNEEGGVELLMPAVQPAEIWQESGRWNKFGKELLRFKDRHGRDYCMGPTHEEVITEIARSYIKSYKQMPVNLYHIQGKFRDEVRPRFGVMRAREFIMKDAYSFDVDVQSAAVSYERMRRAYCKVFERCGLKYKMIDADSGPIGGDLSNEFMVLAHTGEDEVISCDACDYAANLEKAAALPVEPSADITFTDKLQEVFTPNAHTVRDVAAFLNIPVQAVVKTIILKADERLVALLIRGDHEVNTTKVKNFLRVPFVEFAEPQHIEAVSGPVGFSGPIGLNIPIYVDYSVEKLPSMAVGGNKRDLHIIGAKLGVDFKAEAVGDFRAALVGDVCPKCGGRYNITRGIEVGHIFYLGSKYSESMQACFTDADGVKKPIEMGCYGIGVSRIAAAAIEQNHDERGIIWPIPIAPFEVALFSLNSNNREVTDAVELLYKTLLEAGVEVIYDDRDERAGVKLSDADLIGYPVRITVGEKSYKNGCAEVKLRKNSEAAAVKFADVLMTVRELLECE